MDQRPFGRFIEDKPILTSDILMSRLYNVKLEHRQHGHQVSVMSICGESEKQEKVSGNKESAHSKFRQ